MALFSRKKGGDRPPMPVIVSVVMCVVILALGVWTFRSLERPVLKEL